MLQIINDSHDPYFNLALEEYVLFNMPGDQNYFILWQNKNAVIVGRNQNTYEEINQDFVKERNISVVRRLSGGGAVYHDLGNINFTFIVNDNQDFTNFTKFTQPVLATLYSLGIKAENNGRNDITIDGKKFSGNAQFKYKGRMLHHGTILFNSNIFDMTEALTPGAAKVASKGIKSVQSRVTNLCDYLSEPVTIEEFKQLLSEEVLKQETGNHIYRLTESDKYAIDQLSKNKYQTWSWNYGASPQYNIKKTGHYQWGSIDIRLGVTNGIIRSCKIYGDFFSDQDIKDLENAFLTAAYREDKILEIIENLNLSSWLPYLTKGEFMELIWGQPVQ